MTGYPDFNAHAFNEATALLRSEEWLVFNPVENDAEAGIVLEGLSGTEEFDFSRAMAVDLPQVAMSDALFALPGWVKSRGARIEMGLALDLGIPVFSFEEGERITMMPPRPNKETLPTDSAERKNIPIVTGLLDYFPAALAAVAAVSKAGNDKHNPGEPLHWARSKSMDQADAIGRHLVERGGIDPDTGLRHSAQLAWRALALLQLELEEAGESPMPRGAR